MAAVVTGHWMPPTELIPYFTLPVCQLLATGLRGNIYVSGIFSTCVVKKNLVLHGDLDYLRRPPTK